VLPALCELQGEIPDDHIREETEILKSSDDAISIEVEQLTP
jgi:hypothetical protein